MTFDNNNREKRLREFYETSGDNAVFWISDSTGQIVESLAIESRIRPSEGACQDCLEALNTTDKHPLPPAAIDLVGSARGYSRYPSPIPAPRTRATCPPPPAREGRQFMCRR
jgi:hypothetical protein